MRYVKLFIKGMIVGVANIIPGVSGGTIAVVMGVFDELIDAVNNFYKDFKKHFSFLVPLGAGAVMAVFLFSRVVGYCLANYSFPTNLFFVGLIAGSLPLIYNRAGERGKINWIACACGVLAVLTLALLKEGADRSMITELTAQNAVILVVVGMIASAAMVMPGVSGSFVLVLLGYYSSFLNAVSTLNIPVITAICVGIVLGILIISKIIDILLKKAYTVTYSAILGLIGASLFAILADKTTYATGFSAAGAVSGVLLAVMGFMTAFKLGD